MLELLIEQFGLKVAYKPNIVRKKTTTKFPIGTLRDLGDYVLACPSDSVVEIEEHALTASNVNTVSQKLKLAGYKLHCVKQNGKRLLWAETEIEDVKI